MGGVDRPGQPIIGPAIGVAQVLAYLVLHQEWCESRQKTRNTNMDKKSVADICKLHPSFIDLNSYHQKVLFIEVSSLFGDVQ